MNANNIDSATSTNEANSSIVDEFLRLCEASDDNRTDGSSRKASALSKCEKSPQDKFAPRIGIVVPIYNVAPYLCECLDSVLNQTYKNFHAVLVNDGSTDNSKEIALDYVAKDTRFVLIDKANGGLSSARNAGIKYFNKSAKNSPQIDYIIFLDSDDFWELDLLEKCIKDIENAEVLLFDIDTFYDGLPPPSSNLQSIA